MYKHIRVPTQGEKIAVNPDFSLNVPDQPIIPFHRGRWYRGRHYPGHEEGGGRRGEARLTAASARSNGWRCTPARSPARYTARTSGCPTRRWQASEEFVVSIKGPLTTPVGGGIRSINVALRQELDLYVCLRPVRYFKGVPSPLKQPEKTDMVIFRENSEDIYAGIEWQAETDNARRE